MTPVFPSQPFPLPISAPQLLRFGVLLIQLRWVETGFALIHETVVLVKGRNTQTYCTVYTCTLYFMLYGAIKRN